MLTLNINIDHAATVRNARGGNDPDPVAVALNAELAGAGGIVCHLREDRRHVKDRDVRLLREMLQTRLDLEMAANPEIINIALDLKPELVTIVPEKRKELTTEGGLDVAANLDGLKKLCEQMHNRGIEVSLFVEPSEDQIHASLLAGADMVEIHTGAYANSRSREELEKHLKIIHNAAEYAAGSGLQVAAGHGLNYFNTQQICMIPYFNELSIGHSIISRAVYVGITQAVREMLALMRHSSALQKSDAQAFLNVD